MVSALTLVDMYNLCKSSADLEPTLCSGQQDELIRKFCVIMYLYDVKCSVCK